VEANEFRKPALLALLYQALPIVRHADQFSVQTTIARPLDSQHVALVGNGAMKAAARQSGNVQAADVSTFGTLSSAGGSQIAAILEDDQADGGKAHDAGRIAH
jgi:hypothetical protein